MSHVLAAKAWATWRTAQVRFTLNDPLGHLLDVHLDVPVPVIAAGRPAVLSWFTVNVQFALPWDAVRHGRTARRQPAADREAAAVQYDLSNLGRSRLPSP